MNSEGTVGIPKLRVLDLFSGIGGFALGLDRTGGFETAAFCEINKACQKVLQKHWPDVPIYEDVRTLDHDGAIDVITGGYPCQPFSTAGKRQGQEDDRHLWPAMFALIQKHRPAWVIGENVTGHISMGLDSVLSDLESENYQCRTFVIPASALDAKHRRERLWIVANTNSKHGRASGPSEAQSRATTKIGAASEQSENVAYANRKSKGRLSSGKAEEHTVFTCTGQDVSNANSRCGNSGRDETGRQKRANTSRRCARPIMANTQCKRCKQMEPSIAGRKENKGPTSAAGDGCRSRGWEGWEPEPGVGRVADGVPNRVDRLRGLGNAVVPQIPEMIGHAILEAERQTGGFYD